MGYLKQHCFTVDNVKEFFLSPYTYIVKLGVCETPKAA